MAMEKKRQLPSLPQVAKIAALLGLFLFTPFVPSSLRSPYLYLLFNALVFTLGVEAGFLTAISGGPHDDNKKPLSSSTNIFKPIDNHRAAANAQLAQRNNSNANSTTIPAHPNTKEINNKLGADVLAMGVSAASMKKRTIKKCPSRASIFFIGSAGAEAYEDATVHEEEEAEKGAGEPMSKQELFTKAEAFIGNFYKQLKMQREESWKKLQDLYCHHHYKAKAF